MLGASPPLGEPERHWVSYDAKCVAGATSHISHKHPGVVQVQLDIREGHAQTVDKVLAWLPEDLSGVTVCDAGCGTGSLALPLAMRGAEVAGFDISQAMARLPGLP